MSANMKAVAQQMNRLQESWNRKADEVAELVRDGSLTPDEAAACLAGADLKEREAIYEDSGFRPGPGGDIYVARQAIDERLSDYRGLVIGRHV